MTKISHNTAVTTAKDANQTAEQRMARIHLTSAADVAFGRDTAKVTV